MSAKQIVSLVDSDTEPVVQPTVAVQKPTTKPVSNSIDLTLSDDEAPAPPKIVVPISLVVSLPPLEPITEEMDLSSGGTVTAEEPKDSTIPETRPAAPLEATPVPMEIEPKETPVPMEVEPTPEKKQKKKKPKKASSESSEPKKDEAPKKKAPKKVYALDDRYDRIGKHLHMLALDTTNTSDDLRAPNQEPIREEGCIKTCLDALSPLRIGRQKLSYRNFVARFIKAMQAQDEVKASLLAARIMLLVNGHKNPRDLGFVKKRLQGFNTFVNASLWENGSGDIWYVLGQLADEMAENLLGKYQLTEYFRSLKSNLTEKKRGIFVMIAFMCRNRRKDTETRSLLPLTQDVVVNIPSVLENWKSGKIQVDEETFYKPTNLPRVEKLAWETLMQKYYSSAYIEVMPTLTESDSELFNEIEKALTDPPKEDPKAPEETPEKPSEEVPKEKKTKRKAKEGDSAPTEKRQKKEKVPTVEVHYDPLPEDIKNNTPTSFRLRKKAHPFFVNPKGLLRGPLKSVRHLEFASKTLEFLVKEKFIILQNAEILFPKIYKEGDDYYVFYPFEVPTDQKSWTKDEPITFGVVNLLSFLSLKGNEDIVPLIFRSIYSVFIWLHVLGCRNHNLEDNVFMDQKGKLYFLGYETYLGKISKETPEEDLTTPKTDPLFFISRPIPSELSEAFLNYIGDNQPIFYREVAIIQACLGIYSRESAEEDTGEKLPSSLEQVPSILLSFMKGSDKEKEGLMQNIKDAFSFASDCVGDAYEEEADDASAFFSTSIIRPFGATSTTTTIALDENSSDDEDFVPQNDEENSEDDKNEQANADSEDL